MRYEYFLIVAAAILLSSLQLLRSNTPQVVTASDDYCEMVSLWYATGGSDTEEGDLGWPDYRGIYKEACND